MLTLANGLLLRAFMGEGRDNSNHADSAFLDRLANEMKIGRGSSYRRAVRRTLEIVKKNYESGQYGSTTEAAHIFRRMVEKEDEANQ